MAQAIKELPNQTLPSEARISGLLDGLDKINQLIALLIEGRDIEYPRVV